MISDAEMKKIARNIIQKSLVIKPKESMIIYAGPKSLKFAEMMAYEAAVLGANPSISYVSDELSLKIYKDIDKGFLKNIPKLSRFMANNIDVEIFLDDSDPELAKQIPQDKVSIRSKAMKPIKNIKDRRFVNKTIKSVLVGYPNKETAKSLNIPFAKLSNIFWKSLSADPYKLCTFNARLMKKLRGADKIHIVGQKTDIEFSVKGREPMNDCGLWEEDKIGYFNLPAGEIFYAPVETSANGEIYFDLPCLWHFGKQVEGVWFRFKNGEVVEYKINKGQKNFEDVMKHATGKKKSIAELGIGTNPNARFTGGMTIVDEKLLGTIHMAIGWNKGYGGKNDSSIHWDFFKNMRPKGSVMYVDGKVFMKNGKFV